jgi:hypothetical protein
MIDELRQTPDFPQCLADTKGNIYRRYNNGKLRKLSQKSDKDGYMVIRISHQGRRRSLKVHRLVCGAFHSECPENMMTRHLNGIRIDNTPDNFCWGTPQENSDDKIRHGTICTGERHGRAKITQETAELIRRRYNDGESQMSIAADVGIVQSVVSEIVLHKIWK